MVESHALPSEEGIRLLAEFHRLRPLQAPRTFMEIAGNAHHENVCSNILAFYLNPALEHNLKDLLLRALMNCLAITWEAPIPEGRVLREEQTKVGGRLDLLILTKDFVIGIENKVWAFLYNDLGDYAALIASKAAESQIKTENCFRVVLSIRKLTREEGEKAAAAGFKVLSAAELIGETRKLLGYYARQADARHLTYFLDFLQTLENLSGSMNNELNQFFFEHGKRIQELNSAYLEYQHRLIPEVMGLLKETEVGMLSESDLRLSIYQKTTLVALVRCSMNSSLPQGVSVDLTNHTDGWEVNLFSRNFNDYKISEVSKRLWDDLSIKLQRSLGEGFQLEVDSLSAKYTNQHVKEITDQLVEIIKKVRIVANET